LSRFGFAALAPQPADQSFDNWWRKVDEAAKDLYKSGLNSLIILGPGVSGGIETTVFSMELPQMSA
jgi:esterase/lipase